MFPIGVYLSSIRQSAGVFRFNDFTAFRAFCEYTLLAVRLELNDRLMFQDFSVTERAVTERLVFGSHRESGGTMERVTGESTAPFDVFDVLGEKGEPATVKVE